MSETATTRDKEGFFRPILEKLFPFLAVFPTMWRMLRHPFAFDDYLRTSPSKIVAFFFVSAGLSSGFWGHEPRAVALAASVFGGSLDRTNTLIHSVFPKITVEVTYLIPVITLIAAVIFGFCFHWLWQIGRLLLSETVKRRLRKGAGVAGRPVKAALGASMFGAGVAILMLTIMPASAVLLSSDLAYHGTEISLPEAGSGLEKALQYAITALMIYCMFIVGVSTPVWLARAYGLRLPVVYLMSLVIFSVLAAPFSTAQAPAANIGYDEAPVSRTYRVYFEFQDENLSRAGRDILRRAAQIAIAAYRRGGLQYVEVNGAIDTAEADRPELAWHRAANVGSALAGSGAPEILILARSFGAQHLIVPTPKNIREPQNRYVLIRVVEVNRGIDANTPLEQGE